MERDYVQEAFERAMDEYEVASARWTHRHPEATSDVEKRLIDAWQVLKALRGGA
jgi:hypothetical protein